MLSDWGDSKISSGHIKVIQSLTIFYTIVTGFILIFFRDTLIPEHFSFDGQKIQGISQGEIVVLEDESYTIVGNIYRILGMQASPVAAGILGLLLFVIAVLFSVKRQTFQGRAWTVVLSISVSILLASVYLGTYSKDVFVLPVVLLILLSRQSKWWDCFICIAMLLYAMNFRQYWYLILVVYLIFRMTLPRIRSVATYLSCVMASVAASGAAIYYGMDISPDGFRTNVNNQRDLTVDATTAILPFNHMADPLGGIINNCITFVTLIIPLPLLRLGSIYYFAIFVIFAFVWLTFFACVKNVMVKKQVLGFRADARLVRSIALATSFIIVQSIFEPDYGSALRHLTPLLPVFLFTTLRMGSLSRQTHSQESV